LVYDIGGGPREGRIKAVQIGGPSGGCIPEHLFDVPVDFDSLNEIGAMMGSGGLVVMDESDCMVAVARYFLSFTQAESCGKCTPCRVGTYRMLRIMDRIVEGKGCPGDLEELERLGRWIKETSLCGLGRSAPNPILSTLRYFRDEYVTHIEDRFCPTGLCRSPGHFQILAEECIWCGLCAEACEDGAVRQSRKGFHIDPRLCTGCGRCRAVCPTGAVVLVQEVAA